MPEDHTTTPYAVRAWVRGRVQGVGFRWWTRARALELGLVGYARNCADGRVEVWAQGERAAVTRLVALLDPASSCPGSARGEATRPGEVTGLVVGDEAARPDLTGFTER